MFVVCVHPPRRLAQSVVFEEALRGFVLEQEKSEVLSKTFRRGSTIGSGIKNKDEKRRQRKANLIRNLSRNATYLVFDSNQQPTNQQSMIEN